MKPAAIGDNRDITKGYESTQLQRLQVLQVKYAPLKPSDHFSIFSSYLQNIY